MALKTRSKEHHDDALVYDALQVLDFDTVTPAGAIANSTISGQFCLGVSMKIFAVTIVQTGTISVTAFNVIAGIGADATPNNPIGTPDTSDSFVITSPGNVTGGSPPTLAAVGTALFAADQAVTLTTGVPQTFFPQNFDVIYPSAQVAGTAAANLTLRLVASGAGGACKVCLLAKPYDIKQYSPRNTSFIPSSDIA